MATIEEKSCHDDTDCPDKQYCYHVSERCVDFTQCSRYNREENSKGRSRHPSRCGPCFPGYTAEKLSTGEMALLCRKINAEQSISETYRLNSNIIIYTTLGILTIFGVLTLLIIIFYKKRTSKRQNNNIKQSGELRVMEPTAPPLENSPFITCKKKSSPVPFNNNKNLKDKNNLVRATCCAPPYRDHTNFNYENDQNNDNATEPLHYMSNQSNNWTSEQLTREVINGNLSGYEVAQMDNILNTTLIQTDNASSSNSQEDNNNNNTNNDDSRSESSNTQNNREHIRISNILISQKISMNVNLLNNDS
ncbi:GATA zinc finger domain-containing protein 4-like [Apis florea]|uniref:GATA zinc finger domain-containing protein 4-like n=1 Tax=Apis florea TaxID=7463 RepID=UPI000252B6EF|nr:GATA zinc finger domain-containing protein 4-like [Apis florea]